MSKFHKNITPSPCLLSLNTLFDSQNWKTNEKERKEFTNFYNKLPGDYDRFRIQNSIKIYKNTSYLPEILNNCKYVQKNSNFDENSKKNESFIEFLNEFHEEFYKEFVSKKFFNEKSEQKPEISTLFLQNEEIPKKTEELSEKIKKELKTEEKTEKIEEKTEKEEEKLAFENFEESKNEEISENPLNSSLKLSENDYKFLERFYFLLDIDKSSFISLSHSSQLSLLHQKYSKYITSLSEKFQMNSSYSFKPERDSYIH